MMDRFPEIAACRDEELADIMDWIDSKQLSRAALHVFNFSPIINQVCPLHHETIALFRQQKEVLLGPLREVDSLLDSRDQWGKFANCLLYSGGKFSRSAAEKGRASQRDADTLRKKIHEKTIEIVTLAGELEKLGGYVEAGEPSLLVYPDLLRRAAAIHNGDILHTLPGIAADCIFDEAAAKRLVRLLKKASGFSEKPYVYYDSLHPIPSIEAVILAYGQYVGEDIAGVNDALRKSRKTSPADFVRGFTDELLGYVSIGLLPEKIKTLSFGSLTIFMKLFYPYTTSKSNQFITATWEPKKDVIKK